MFTVEFYQTPQGDSPVDLFLDGLPEKPRGKIEKWLKLLEEKGPDLPRPYADLLQGKIRELRVSFGKYECRLYFIHGKTIVITNGFLKKTQKIPQDMIDRAERCRMDWLSRYGERGG
ncbi:MAG: type II toxin-antitoxin system RelE/ParE family toxin [Nitrospirae bacterium]|nr:type II toxin-antitoxin system RelE/ParE family toxin [Nitrospirota bacterium]